MEKSDRKAGSKSESKSDQEREDEAANEEKSDEKEQKAPPEDDFVDMRCSEDRDDPAHNHIQCLYCGQVVQTRNFYSHRMRHSREPDY
jgi:hypothetical protein